MNKRQIPGQKEQKNKWSFLTQKPVLIIAGIFSVLSVLLIVSVSLAQSSTVTVGPDETLDLLCNGRGFQISRISRTHLSVTCQPGRGQQPTATATAEPLPPTPEPTLDPGQPPQPPQTQQAIYVAPNGNNSWPGTVDQPVQTIQKGVDLAQPGETVFVRAGTYVETVTIDKSGTAGQPITISAYPGETPVIDGQYNLPTGNPARCNNTVNPPKCFVYAPLVKIRGSHIVFSGIEVTHSRGRGITVTEKNGVRPQSVTVEKCYVHDVRNSGIMVLAADQVTVDGCEVYHASDFATHDRSPSVLNWPVIVNAIDSTYVTFANNVIHENWGEGIAAGRDSSNIQIVDNLIYNNYALQIYVHRSQNVTVEQNLLYHTNDPAFNRGGSPSQCIVVNNETNFTTSQTTRNVNIVNNFVAGCRRNISIWGSQGSGLPIENVLISHNTLVNAVTNTSTPAFGLHISDANLMGIQATNNIVIQDDQTIAYAPTNPEVTFANNLWSRTPAANVMSNGDYVGDAALTNSNMVLTPGGVDANWFTVTGSSPAMNRAQPGFVVEDFFGNGRDSQPDIGAHENR